MRRFTGPLAIGVFTIAACTATPASVAPGSGVDPVEHTGTVMGTTAPPITTTTSPITTTKPSDAAVSTTVGPPVDRADPRRLISADLGVDVVVSTESKTAGLIDPKRGEVMWVPVGDRDPGPGEPGLVLIAGHLNIGEPFYHLVDDSSLDRRNGGADRGLTVGATLDFMLADGTRCRYRVVEPIGTDLPDVEPVPDQPAIYFPKRSEVMNPILARLIAEVGDRAIVTMWVSYAGPNNDQWRPNGTNRANNAAVFAELETCTDPFRE